MDPGPLIASVLYDQDSHVSSAIWEGKEKHVLKTCQQTQKLKGWVLNEEQQQLVHASGLGHLALNMGFVVDRFLVTAFCERWRRETNTAHFLGFEMAPSLRDVSYIMGLSVSGRVVTGEPVGQSGVTRLCLKYLGKVPGRRNTKSGLIRLTWLYDEFYILPENPSTNEIVYSTRAYLLYLIGCSVLAESEKGLVSSRYLPLLGDFDKIRDYAWGAAALANLYRGLSIATEPDTKYFAGSATLLVAWIYEYLPVMRPKLKNQTPPPIPRFCKWKFKAGIHGPRSSSVLTYRKNFDLLQVSDVNWTPYEDMDPTVLPEYCNASDYISRARTWLICFHIKEIYVPERYARQFGEEQHIPDDVPRWSRVGWSMFKDWRQEYVEEIEEYHHLVDTRWIPTFKFKEICTADQYSEWYRQITRLRIHPPSNDPKAREYSDDKLRTMVDSLKRDLPVINHYLEGLLLPSEVANSLKRLNELTGPSQPAVCFRRPKQAAKKRKRFLKIMENGIEQERLSNPSKPSETLSLLSPDELQYSASLHPGISERLAELVSKGIEHEMDGGQQCETPEDFDPPQCSDSPTPSRPPLRSGSLDSRERQVRRTGQLWRPKQAARKQKRVLKFMENGADQEQYPSPPETSDPLPLQQPSKGIEHEVDGGKQSEKTEAFEPPQGSNSPTTSRSLHCPGSPEFSKKQVKRESQGPKGTSPLRRSGRPNVQIKQFKHRGGDGGDSSNPISI